MLSLRILIVAVCVLFLSFLGQKAFADSGQVKLELQDPVAVGMGSAFTGEADRPSAVYYNPAGIVQMDSAEVTAGLTWVQPQLKFESTSGNTSEAKEDNYLIPDVFVTTPIYKDKLFIGLGESTDFGGGNDYEANGFSQDSTIKDSITDEDYRLVLAYKVNDQWSIGGGPVNDQSHFEHDTAFAGGGGGNALFKANDNAWGFDLATMFKLNTQNQFGLDYKSPIHHDYDGHLYLSDMNPGILGGLFGGVSSYSTKAIDKLTLPQSVTLGYDLKLTPKWTFNFDLEWTDWAQYKEQILDYPNLTQTQASNVGSGVSQARDWESDWAESLGAQYALLDNLRLRLGYEHHQSFVPQANFDTDFPDFTTNAITCGVGYDITRNLTIDVAYIAAFDDTRKVNTTIGSGALDGKYNGFINVGTLSLTYKF